MPDGDLTLSQAARMLGVSRDTVRGRLERLGITARWVGASKVLSPVQFEELRASVSGIRKGIRTT